MLDRLDFDPTKYSLTHEISAGGVVLTKMAKGAEVVVIERAAMNDISLPKGHADPGESLQETARREVKEETGFDTDVGSYLGSFTYQVKSDKTAQLTLRTVHWFLLVAKGGKPRSPNEEVKKVRLEPLNSDFSFLTYDNDRMFIRRAKEITRLRVSRE